MNAMHTSLLMRLKPLLFIVCLIPVFRWIIVVMNDQLGMDPAQFMMQSSGLVTLLFLCLTLSATPLRVLLSTPELLQWRRMIGLFTFFYACCHAIFWFWLDRRLSFVLAGTGVAERPFIALGVLSWLMLLALALTSSQAMVRKLGRNWRRLHRLVYVVAILVMVHMGQMQAADSFDRAVLIGLLVLSFLLLWRVVYAYLQGRCLQDTLEKIKPYN